jgi:hypothetical protein
VSNLRLTLGSAGLAVLLAVSAPALGANKYKQIIFINDWTGTGEEVKVTAGGDTWTYPFTEAGTAAECAAAFAAAAPAPFTVQIASNNNRGVRICHPTDRPVVEKKQLKNYRCYSFSFFNDPTPAFASTNLIEVRGQAVGGGFVSLAVEDLNVMVPTLPGQTAEEVANAVVQELDAITPDDDTAYTFGTEFTVANFGDGPLDSADIGIWSLGGRDLSDTFFESTDPGILMSQEPVEPDGCNFLEDFDAYLLGSGLHGQAGWKGWDDDPAFDAPVTDVQARSAPHSVEIAGPTDLVREHCALGGGSGFWSYSAWQYIPTEFASGGGGQFAGTYFVLLNTYNDGGPYHWSVQMQFDSNDGMLKVYHGDGLNTIDVPYVTDRWVKIQAVIDLDNDWTQVYYDDELITEYSWTGGVLGDGGGQLDIAAVDLFANGSSPVFYDDLVLVPLSDPLPCPWDLNEDNSVGISDLLILLANWGTAGPGDFDNSGSVGIGDLLALLANWGACP